MLKVKELDKLVHHAWADNLVTTSNYTEDSFTIKQIRNGSRKLDYDKFPTVYIKFRDKALKKRRNG